MSLLLGLTILLMPTYAVRFSVAGVPLNFLMVWVAVLWVITFVLIIVRKDWRKFWDALWQLDRRLLILVGLFFLSGIISLFVGGLSREKVGQFLVLFIQPLSLFWIVRYSLHVDHDKTIAHVKAAALIFLGVAGAFAIVQYFTLSGLPPAWWGNANEPKRAISYFLHPNFYSLFITPLLAYLIPDIFATATKFWKSEGRVRRSNTLILIFYVWGLAGLLLSLSRGGWLGLLVAVIVFVIVKANKRLILGVIVGAIIIAGVVAAVPNLRYRAILPFKGEKSSVARLSLWDTGWKMIKDSPIVGKGLLGFSNNWYHYNTDPGLEHYPDPHNIILNFWVDTGLLGLLSFAGLWIYAVWRGIQFKSDPLKLGLALFLIALAVHGLIDIPYLKNDLALVFWLMYGLSM